MAKSVVPPTVDEAASAGENAACIASAMQFNHGVQPWSSTVEFLGGLRDHPSLIARAGKFVLARLAAAVAAGDRGRAIGRPAGDVVELHLTGETVVEADNGHPEVQQVGDDRKQRGFLAAVLGR